jgi:DNA-binding protein YbaB
MGGMMNQQKHTMAARTKEFISVSREKIIQSSTCWISTIQTYSDAEGLLSLTIDNTQILHSINLSEKLFTTFKKQDILVRLTQFINKAIIHAGRNAARDMQNVFSAKEFMEMLSLENREVRDHFEQLIKRNNQSVQELALIKKTINSESGNTTVIVFGNRMIHLITINDEFFSIKNKSLIEGELLGAVNKAMREIIEEIRVKINKNEEEFNKYIIQE